jgi:hypothetical protein
MARSRRESRRRNGITNPANLQQTSATKSATTNRYVGMLSGRYFGATAEASIAVGLGANVLVGGSRRSVALQPLSIQGQTGFNIAAGVGELRLSLAGPPIPPGPPGPPR